MNYKQAKELLDGTSLRLPDGSLRQRKGRTADRVKIARNTFLERGDAFSFVRIAPIPFGYMPTDGYYQSASKEYPDNAIGLRYHETYVAVLTPRWTELFTGGWNTKTTSERINMGLPAYCGVGARASKGWGIYLRKDDIGCYCMNDINMVRSRPGAYLSRQWNNGWSVDVWVPCPTCNGTLIRSSEDYASGGITFYDGIRVSADGKRIMKEQPHKPQPDLDRSYAVITESARSW